MIRFSSSSASSTPVAASPRTNARVSRSCVCRRWSTPGSRPAANAFRYAGTPPTEIPPKLAPWNARSRPTNRVRVASPRKRWYASAILSAVSTASEPELVKNACPMPSGASATTRCAASNASGWPSEYDEA